MPVPSAEQVSGGTALCLLIWPVLSKLFFSDVFIVQFAVVFTGCGPIHTGPDSNHPSKLLPRPSAIARRMADGGPICPGRVNAGGGKLWVGK